MSMPVQQISSLEKAIVHIRQVIQNNPVPTEVYNAPPAFTGDPVQRARQIYTFRRKRDTFMEEVSDLFHDPAWDLLLDLFVASEQGSNISVSSACIASSVPPTTGLRMLMALKERGLLAFEPDPFDKRRSFVRLSEAMRQRMRALMTEA